MPTDYPVGSRKSAPPSALCPTCEGTGLVPTLDEHGTEPCDTCEGLGTLGEVG